VLHPGLAPRNAEKLLLVILEAFQRRLCFECTAFTRHHVVCDELDGLLRSLLARAVRCPADLLCFHEKLRTLSRHGRTLVLVRTMAVALLVRTMAVGLLRANGHGALLSFLVGHGLGGHEQGLLRCLSLCSVLHPGLAPRNAEKLLLVILEAFQRRLCFECTAFTRHHVVCDELDGLLRSLLARAVRCPADLLCFHEKLRTLSRHGRTLVLVRTMAVGLLRANGHGALLSFLLAHHLGSGDQTPLSSSVVFGMRYGLGRVQQQRLVLLQPLHRGLDMECAVLSLGHVMRHHLYRFLGHGERLARWGAGDGVCGLDQLVAL